MRRRRWSHDYDEERPLPDLFASFDPDRPVSSVRAKLGRSAYMLPNDEEDEDDGYGFGASYDRDPLWLVRWPDETIGLMSSPSKRSLMMTLDEIADPGMAMVKPYTGPLFLEFERSLNFVNRRPDGVLRNPPEFVKPKRPKRTTASFLRSGQFSDFTIVAHNGGESGESSRIGCHRLILMGVPFFAKFLTENPEATEIQLEAVPHFEAKIVELAVRYAYSACSTGLQLSWDPVMPADTKEIPAYPGFGDQPKGTTEEEQIQAVSSNVEKWINVLVKVRACAKAFGLPNLALSADKKMERAVSSFHLQKSRLRTMDQAELARHNEAQTRSVTVGVKAMWTLSGQLQPRHPRLTTFMRNELKEAVPEEEFVKILTPSEDDLRAYRAAKSRQWDAQALASEVEPCGGGGSWRVKVVSIDHTPVMTGGIEAAMFPHRFYVKQMAQSESEDRDWTEEMKRAVVKDEEYLESKTHHEQKSKALEGRTDFQSQLMKMMNLTSPEVLSDLIDPTIRRMAEGMGLLRSTQDPPPAARPEKRSRDEKDERDPDEPPTKRRKLQ